MNRDVILEEFQKLDVASSGTIPSCAFEQVLSTLGYPAVDAQRLLQLWDGVGEACEGEVQYRDLIDWLFESPGELIARMTSIRLVMQVVFCAVGGAAEHRNQRGLLLNACCPQIKGCSVALAGSHYSATKPFPIPSWIPSVIDVLGEPLPSLHGSCFPLEERDLLLVIGHIHEEEFEAFKSLHPRLQHENVWVQGGTESSFNLKMRIGHSIDGTLCPNFSIEDWKPTLELYPDLLKRMRNFQWGGFFSSRLPALIRSDKETGLTMEAFYRQFGLHEIPRKGNILRFEKEVLQCAGCDERLQRVVEQIDRTANDDMDDGAKLKSVHQAYSDNGPWVDEELVSLITNSLWEVIPRYTPLSIKEYDSYAAHLMLRHYGDISGELAPAFHMEFVQTCLRHQRDEHGSLDGDSEAYVQKLRMGLIGRKVMVLHDLGLDPMSDDWLAICMILTVVGDPTSGSAPQSLS